MLRLPRELEDKEDLLDRLVSELRNVGRFRSIVWLLRISGETRKPEIKILYGKETKTIHREAGVSYVVDVAKVMFSRLNRKERERMASVGSSGEVAVDMFAGIGYFTLPLATRVSKVYAIEMNPDALELLIEALEINSLDNVVPILSDNRKVLLDSVADRIVMGYLFETERFLAQARRFAKPRSVVHFHRIFPSKLSRDQIADQVTNWFSEHFSEVRILGIHRIKNYAPGKVHYVVDVECKKER